MSNELRRRMLEAREAFDNDSLNEWVSENPISASQIIQFFLLRHGMR